MTVTPDPEDHATIERKYGRCSLDDSDEKLAHRYQLAQANKILRMWRHGKLPVEQMRAIDKIAKK